MRDFATRDIFRPLFCLLLGMLLAGLLSCAKDTSWRTGGVKGTKPYTVRGKTYYPLKSGQGFVEEGIASWYGPGFHGKKTANGEIFDQDGISAAHKILPLGETVQVTHLGSGKRIVVRINDRGPFVDDRVIDLSRGAARQLGILGTGTARVRLASIGSVPGLEQGKSGSIDLLGEFFVQIGAFGSHENARKLARLMTRLGHSGRIVFGSNNMWNVQLGPWNDTAEAEKALQIIRKLYPAAFVVGA